MFFSARPPEPLVGGRIEALQLSLNAPVVAVEELPVGPARAGIALWREEDGRRALLVGVRSVRGGHGVCYVAEEEISGGADARGALDAALSFAEGMGFLFDDDLVASAGEKAARERWSALAELEACPRAPERVDPAGAGRTGAEILLEELAPALPLSKFRRVAAGERPGVRLVAGPSGGEADPGAGRVTRF